MNTRRRRKDGSLSSSYFFENFQPFPKRPKVHAQRKFAQGTNVTSPSVTPIKEFHDYHDESFYPDNRPKLALANHNENIHRPSHYPVMMHSINQPKTEDFLTFLCFRGTPVLPPELEALESPYCNGSHLSSELQLNVTPPSRLKFELCNQKDKSGQEESRVDQSIGKHNENSTKDNDTEVQGRVTRSGSSGSLQSSVVGKKKRPLDEKVLRRKLLLKKKKLILSGKLSKDKKPKLSSSTLMKSKGTRSRIASRRNKILKDKSKLSRILQRLGSSAILSSTEKRSTRNCNDHYVPESSPSDASSKRGSPESITPSPVSSRKSRNAPLQTAKGDEAKPNDQVVRRMTTSVLSCKKNLAKTKFDASLERRSTVKLRNSRASLPASKGSNMLSKARSTRSELRLRVVKESPSTIQKKCANNAGILEEKTADHSIAAHKDDVDRPVASQKKEGDITHKADAVDYGKTSRNRKMKEESSQLVSSKRGQSVKATKELCSAETLSQKTQNLRKTSRSLSNTKEYRPGVPCTRGSKVFQRKPRLFSSSSTNSSSQNQSSQRTFPRKLSKKSKSTLNLPSSSSPLQLRAKKLPGGSSQSSSSSNDSCKSESETEDNSKSVKEIALEKEGPSALNSSISRKSENSDELRRRTNKKDKCTKPKNKRASSLKEVIKKLSAPQGEPSSETRLTRSSPDVPLLKKRRNVQSPVKRESSGEDFVKSPKKKTDSKKVNEHLIKNIKVEPSESFPISDVASNSGCDKSFSNSDIQTTESKPVKLLNSPNEYVVDISKDVQVSKTPEKRQVRSQRTQSMCSTENFYSLNKRPMLKRSSSAESTLSSASSKSPKKASSSVACVSDAANSFHSSKSNKNSALKRKRTVLRDEASLNAVLESLAKDFEKDIDDQIYDEIEKDLNDGNKSPEYMKPYIEKQISNVVETEKSNTTHESIPHESSINVETASDEKQTGSPNNDSPDQISKQDNTSQSQTEIPVVEENTCITVDSESKPELSETLEVSEKDCCAQKFDSPPASNLNTLNSTSIPSSNCTFNENNAASGLCVSPSVISSADFKSTKIDSVALTHNAPLSTCTPKTAADCAGSVNNALSSNLAEKTVPFTSAPLNSTNANTSFSTVSNTPVKQSTVNEKTPKPSLNVLSQVYHSSVSVTLGRNISEKQTVDNLKSVKSEKSLNRTVSKQILIAPKPSKPPITTAHGISSSKIVSRPIQIAPKIPVTTIVSCPGQISNANTIISQSQVGHVIQNIPHQIPTFQPFASHLPPIHSLQPINSTFPTLAGVQPHVQTVFTQALAVNNNNQIVSVTSSNLLPQPVFVTTSLPFSNIVGPAFNLPIPNSLEVGGMNKLIPQNMFNKMLPDSQASLTKCQPIMNLSAIAPSSLPFPHAIQHGPPAQFLTVLPVDPPQINLTNALDVNTASMTPLLCHKSVPPLNSSIVSSLKSDNEMVIADSSKTQKLLEKLPSMETTNISSAVSLSLAVSNIYVSNSSSNTLESKICSVKSNVTLPLSVDTSSDQSICSSADLSLQNTELQISSEDSLVTQANNYVYSHSKTNLTLPKLSGVTCIGSRAVTKVSQSSPPYLLSPSFSGHPYPVLPPKDDEKSTVAVGKGEDEVKTDFTEEYSPNSELENVNSLTNDENILTRESSSNLDNFRDSSSEATPTKQLYIDESDDASNSSNAEINDTQNSNQVNEETQSSPVACNSPSNIEKSPSVVSSSKSSKKRDPIIKKYLFKSKNNEATSTSKPFSPLNESSVYAFDSECETNLEVSLPFLQRKKINQMSSSPSVSPSNVSVSKPLNNSKTASVSSSTSTSENLSSEIVNERKLKKENSSSELKLNGSSRQVKREISSTSQREAETQPISQSKKEVQPIRSKVTVRRFSCPDIVENKIPNKVGKGKSIVNKNKRHSDSLNELSDSDGIKGPIRKQMRTKRICKKSKSEVDVDAAIENKKSDAVMENKKSEDVVIENKKSSASIAIQCDLEVKSNDGDSKKSNKCSQDVDSKVPLPPSASPFYYLPLAMATLGEKLPAQLVQQMLSKTQGLIGAAEAGMILQQAAQLSHRFRNNSNQDNSNSSVKPISPRSASLALQNALKANLASIAEAEQEVAQYSNSTAAGSTSKLERNKVSKDSKISCSSRDITSSKRKQKVCRKSSIVEYDEEKIDNDSDLSPLPEPKKSRDFTPSSSPKSLKSTKMSTPDLSPQLKKKIKTEEPIVKRRSGRSSTSAATKATESDLIEVEVLKNARRANRVRRAAEEVYSSCSEAPLSPASSTGRPVASPLRTPRASTDSSRAYPTDPVIEPGVVELSSDSRMPEAPTFYPSNEDFEDPLEYIEKIRPHAAKFGLCRIVPPPKFRPECRVSDEMRFTTYNQYVHRMMRRFGPGERVLSAIKRCLRRQNVDISSNPVIGGIEVDLVNLYRVVENLGGLIKVIEKKLWPKVAEIIRIPKTSQDVVAKLDSIYCKYLLPYATLSNDEREELMNDVELRYRRAHSRDSEDDCRLTRLIPVDDDQDDDDDDDDDDFDNLECITRGRSTTLSAFYRTARNVTCQYNSESSSSKFDEIYWDIVREARQHICVYTANIDTFEHGYGFSDLRHGGADVKHPWNLKNLCQNPKSVLKHMQNVIGVTSPTLHVGMMFSTVCWYRDPHGLPWMEYLHTGASKIWYGVSCRDEDAFRRALKKYVPELINDTPLWLPSDAAMVPPEDLVSEGVKVCRVVQEPGQFVIVFPEAFTSSICSGYLISESAFFARPSYFDTAVSAFRVLFECSEPSMFSLDQLALCVAANAKAPRDALEAARDVVVGIVQREKSQRQRLNSLGLKSSERLPSSAISARKRRSRYADVEGNCCEICRQRLYVSLVSNSADESVHCLQHAIELLTKEDPDVSSFKLMYLHSMTDLNGIVKQMEDRIKLLIEKKSSTIKTESSFDV